MYVLKFRLPLIVIFILALTLNFSGLLYSNARPLIQQTDIVSNSPFVLEAWDSQKIDQVAQLGARNGTAPKASSQDTVPTPTIYATASINAEQQRIRALLAKYKDIDSLVSVDPSTIRAYPSSDKQFFFVYIDVIVKENTDKRSIAEQIRELTIESLGFEPSEIKIILFDGIAAHEYVWTLTDPSWRITPLPEFKSDGIQITATAPNIGQMQQVTPVASKNSSQRILFIYSTGHAFHFYTINEDGSNLVQLTRTEKQKDHYSYYSNPAWSPDGKKIAFTLDSEEQYLWELFIMNADGTNPVQLTNKNIDGLAPIQFPTWSPDGKKIAFTSRTVDTLGNKVWEIFSMNADGSNIVQLTHRQSPGEYSDITSPKWSPDGTRIVYEAKLGRYFDLYVINPDGSNPVKLTSNPENDYHPAWSPDGKKIVFESESQQSHDIYIMNSDGSNLIRLTNTPDIQESQPAWSPDGKKIVFVIPSPPAALYVINADGSNPTRIFGGTFGENGIYALDVPIWEPKP